jgi:PKD repeat protein
MRIKLLIVLFLAMQLTSINASANNATIENLPEIIDVIPHQPPILIPALFIAVIKKSQDNLTYIWDFGDGSKKETTNTESIKHTYPRKGIYRLTVKVSNKYGESNKSIEINAAAPKEYISDFLEKYKEDLSNVKIEIESLPEWIEKEIEKDFNLTDLNYKVNMQEDRYENASSDDEYIDIMKMLLNIEVPYKFGVSELIKSEEFFQSENQIDFEILKKLGAGEVSESREKYLRAMDLWIEENLDVILELKVYSFYFRNKESKPLISYFNISLKPRNPIGKFYFVINGNPENMAFKNEIDAANIGGNAEGIIFSNLSEIKKIEFLYPENTEIFNLPFYISPEFNKLDLNQSFVVCNNNDICEKENGENYKNCRGDCKPFKLTITFFIILFLIAFIVYIALQEWYKRHYESRLFSNKNNLYNLMSFMNNSLNQGLKKPDIFKKLKEREWSGEQINYSWNKFNGKRTGMFEIPVFRWFEKRKIKRELENRNGNPAYGYNKI